MHTRRVFCLQRFDLFFLPRSHQHGTANTNRASLYVESRACGVRCRACATGKPFSRVERLILEISSFKGYGGYIGEGRGGSLDTLFDGGERGNYRIRCRIVRVTGFRASYDRVASPLSLNRIVFQFLLFPPFFLFRPPTTGGRSNFWRVCVYQTG